VLNSQPDGVTEALRAIPLLLLKPEWGQSKHASSLRAQIAAHLDDPSPHLRFLAVRSLPAVHADPAELAAAVAARIDIEDNADVITQALVVLGSAVPRELADSVLAAADRRTAGPSITELAASDDAERRDLREWWVGAHLNCALWNATPHATMVVRSWFSDPSSAGAIFRTALPLLRSHVSFDADDQIRETVLGLYRSAAAALRQGLASAPEDASIMLAADTMATELYHASGAYEGKTPRPTASQKKKWFADYIGTVESLSAARHPHTCYQLLKTLEFFIEENPVRTFHTVAVIIKDDSAFRYESMGADITAGILDRYLTDYRQVFTTEPKMLTELRHILEVLTTAGWPSALHLSYSLGDVFR
jgi:hypothetical protein